MDRLIMTFKITADRSGINEMEGPWGSAYFIPFGGSVESELFTGKILPGGADVQTENHAKVRHMCAKYMFDGKDSAGNRCRLFVENNGYMNPANRNDPFFAAQPTFLTDSPVLGPYLCQNRFRSEVQGTGEGTLDIRIYDVLSGETER